MEKNKIKKLQLIFLCVTLMFSCKEMKKKQDTSYDEVMYRIRKQNLEEADRIKKITDKHLERIRKEQEDNRIRRIRELERK